MVDAFAPSGPREHLLARAVLYGQLRDFFAARGVLEVETPQLATSFVSDPFIEPIIAKSGEQTLYLQSSPEYAMKRLLAAYGECIYALGKVFRAGERGRRHNPEFTLLEWYRIGFDDRQLMAEVAALITSVLPGTPVHYLSYRQWFMQAFALDPHQAHQAQLQQLAAGLIEIDGSGLDTNAWLDLLVTHILEPQLPTGLTFVYDYPISQAALARIVPDDTGQPVARRFEAFLGG
ncbi:MAG TPA: amino acid--tRNA ligase-related protein, partial [Marinobacter sp.]|nr:amino acid--tRNA ligase-related protein [Marinobacter sp.]